MAPRGRIRVNPRPEPPARTSAQRRIRLVISAMLLCQAHGYSQLNPGPQPPCGNEPVPPYPGLGSPPSVKAWSQSDLGQNWKPPACTGWPAIGFSALVTTAARFGY